MTEALICLGLAFAPGIAGSVTSRQAGRGRVFGGAAGRGFGANCQFSLTKGRICIIIYFNYLYL